ncbi:hypothetical protein [Prochlorococcus sp. MIT 1341]|uniref:hypothetical protein n=1 Tax=Prochlorococcus sp. MIT 1341 TaxID=3096221 RepID=UPI002A75485A|nr:hypothetical protein [Prochlorococcus sp. MIT 1341]
MSTSLLLLVISIGAISLFLTIRQKLLKKYNYKRKRTQSIKTWMEMSPEERQTTEEARKLASIKKRRELLKTIRKEYKALKSTH